MPYVQIPKDLTRIKNKAFLNMTARQIVCFGIGGSIGVPTYLLTKNLIGNSAAVLLMIGLMLPFFFLAMFERDGQPAEKLLRNFIRTRMWPGTRPYKTENLYKMLSFEDRIFNSNHKYHRSQSKILKREENIIESKRKQKSSTKSARKASAKKHRASA